MHRTWRACDGKGKAELKTQRRALVCLPGHAVRLSPHDDIPPVGAGIETMLARSEAAPGFPVRAALPAGHPGAGRLPRALQRFYIAIDRDPARHRAAERLSARATEVGIGCHVLELRREDFNDDLWANGKVPLRQHLAGQIGREDRQRLLA